MKIKTTLLFLSAILCSSLLIAQDVHVDINPNIKHSVGGVSDFGRDRHITVHASITEPEWTDEADKMEYLFNGLDAYMGRDNGAATWKFGATPQDPNNPNHPAIDSMEAFGNWLKGEYESLPHKSFEARSGGMIMGTNAHPTYPTLSWYDNGFTPYTEPKWQPKDIETSRDWVVEYLDKFFAHSASEDGEPLPKYWEVINEPDMEYMTGKFMVTSQEQIWEYHNLIAIGVKQRLGNKAPLIGGMTWGLHDLFSGDGLSRYNPDYLDAYITDPAAAQFYRDAAATQWPGSQTQEWYQWDVMWKGFIDAAGHNMDFYAIHLYDWPTYDATGGTIRSGGHVEATLEMVEWYDVYKNGKNNRKPVVISEYGAVQGAWNYKPHSKRYDWEVLKPFSSMLMQFLERPDYIEYTLPFTPLKATWGDTDANGDGIPEYRYQYSMMRDDDMDGNWEWSDYIKWYELWSEVKGTRIDTKSSDPDIQVDCYIDGSNMYLILNNLEDEATNINLHNYYSGSIQSVNIKHLYLSGVDDIRLDNNNYSTAPQSVQLAADGTMILKYKYSGSVNINQISNEKKYYGQSVSGGTVPHRITIAGGDNTFYVNNVSVPSNTTNAEAMLKITGALYDDNDGYQGHLSIDKLTVNGVVVDAPVDWRGTKQGRSRYFGTLEIPVPANILQTNNTIKVDFHHVGQITVVNLLVWEFSTKPGRYGDDVIDVTGVNLSSNTIEVNKGANATLTATVLPSNASNKSVTWSSANGNIASVNSNGVVTGVAAGNTTITVKTVDGGFSANCQVTVKDTGPISVTGVTVSPTSTSLNINETVQLTENVTPTNATDKTVTWSSTNTSVATVNAQGLVTAVAAGNATLVVRTNDGGFTANSSIIVNQIDDPDGTVVTVEAESFNETGGTLNDAAWGGPGLGVNNAGNIINWVNNNDWAEYINVNIPGQGTYKIEYRIATPSDNAQIQISIDGNVVSTDNVANQGDWGNYYTLTAANQATLSAGTHTIRITATGTNTWQWNLDYIKLTKVSIGDIDVTGVSVSPTSRTLTSAGATVTLSASITPSDATNQNVSWSSNNTAVATVNQSGVVTAVANGNANVTVTTEDGGYTATSIITVDIPVITDQEAYPNGTPHAIPGSIASVNFDKGGEGKAYHDASNGNSGNGPRQDENVDTEYRISAGNVGWIAQGEWLEYTVNVASAGNYKIEVLVASIYTNGAFHIEFDGTDKTGVHNVPNTGNWGTFSTVSVTGVNLSAGTQVMRVYMDGGNFNLGTITISSEGNDPICDVPWTGPNYSVSKATDNWTSGAIDISCIDNAYISMTAAGVGPMENADYLNIYYSVDGGARVAMLQHTNALSSRTVSADNVSGNSVQIIIEGKTSWADETYTVNNISVIDSRLKNSVGQTEDALAMDALVYPNPATDVLNVELLSGIEDNATISVYNSIGTVVLVHDMESTQTQISIGELPNGMYILRINNGNEVTTKRFTKN